MSSWLLERHPSSKPLTRHVPRRGAAEGDVLCSLSECVMAAQGGSCPRVVPSGITLGHSGLRRGTLGHMSLDRQLRVRVPEDLARQVEARANEERRSPSEIVRMALEAFLVPEASVEVVRTVRASVDGDPEVRGAGGVRVGRDGTDGGGDVRPVQDAEPGVGGRVQRPRVPDVPGVTKGLPKDCSHPRESRRAMGYVTICDACGEKIR